MIVSEKDPVGKKIKWYLICLLGNVAILVLVGGTLPFLVIEYFNKTAGGILFLPCFWLAGKLCNSLENYIGIACSLQTPIVTTLYGYFLIGVLRGCVPMKQRRRRKNEYF